MRISASPPKQWQPKSKRCYNRIPRRGRVVTPAGWIYHRFFGHSGDMDNKTAVWFALIIVGIFLADGYYNDWNLTFALGKLLTRTTDWLAFWHNI